MADGLSATFAALADPTRRAILARLAAGPANVSELAEPFLDRMSLPAVTKHVKVLERAGLVVKSRSAQRRPCELQPAALQAAAAWMETYRACWEASLDRLGDYLDTMAAEAQRGPATPESPESPERNSAPDAAPLQPPSPLEHVHPESESKSQEYQHGGE